VRKLSIVSCQLSAVSLQLSALAYRLIAICRSLSTRGGGALLRGPALRGTVEKPAESARLDETASLPWGMFPERRLVPAGLAKRS
jgi:hypothetical protein